jgi:flavodoxin
MKVVIVYFSKYGNTRRVAETIATVLAQIAETRVLSYEVCSLADLKTADVIVFGSPTHFQAVPKVVRSFFKAVPKGSLKGKWITAFDTSMPMWRPIMLLTAAHGIMSRLHKLGGKKFIRSETFLVHSVEVPDPGDFDLLNAGELAHAERWAQGMMNRLKARGII